MIVMKRFLIVLAVASVPSLASAQSVTGGSFVTPSQLSAAAAANLAAMTAAVPSLAPVQTVNGITPVSGNVAVPIPLAHITTGGLALTSGAVTWTFPAGTFPSGSTIRCTTGIEATSPATYSYFAPVYVVNTTAGVPVSVTFTVNAMLKSITIALGSLTLSVAAPAGTSISAICFQQS